MAPTPPTVCPLSHENVHSSVGISVVLVFSTGLKDIAQMGLLCLSLIGREINDIISCMVSRDCDCWSRFF